MREEQRSLFRKKVPTSSASWSQRFCCLHSTSADRVPCSQDDKLTLEEAGLGEKMLVVQMDCSPEEFSRLLCGAYPKLESGGGFELLRCKPKSRDLLLIGPRISNCPKLLKRRVGNGKVYIRPIQRDLSLEEVVVPEEVEGVSAVCVCVLLNCITLLLYTEDTLLLSQYRINLGTIYGTKVSHFRGSMIVVGGGEVSGLWKAVPSGSSQGAHEGVSFQKQEECQACKGASSQSQQE